MKNFIEELDYKEKQELDSMLAIAVIQAKQSVETYQKSLELLPDDETIKIVLAEAVEELELYKSILKKYRDYLI